MRTWLKRDWSRKACWLLAAALILARLALGATQLLLLTPNSALLDDTLLYKAAVSISQGQWLGEYGWLTLSKYPLFSIWLAGLHLLRIPYLLGGQLLYTLAAALGAAALFPVLRQNRLRLLAFAALLYNPAAMAAEVQLRVYRDNITPALALLFFAGYAGYALRRKAPLKTNWGWLALAGLGLAGNWLNREDGVWLLPFALAATAALAAFCFWEKETADKGAKCAALCLPFALTAAAVLAVCAVNGAYYGRFVLSDFTSREFNDAYGAMVRVESAAPQDKVPVPHDVRRMLYEHVPLLAELEPFLESDAYYNDYGSVPEQEFYGGGFYWALRRAVSEAGYYADANTAKAYYEKVAAQVNALCEDGTLPAGPRRSGTTPKIEAKYVWPTLKETAGNLARVLMFREAEPAYWTEMSLQMNAEPELRSEYETFLRNGCNWQAQAGSDLPYYSPVRQIAYKLLTAVQWLYALALPVAFAAALFCQCRAAAWVFRLREKRPCAGLLVWVLLLGLLLCMILRCAIIAFMFTASFNNVPHIMYLAAVHPIALLYTLLGLAVFGKKEARHG